MTYSEPLVSQLNYFLLSLGFGVLIDFWYVFAMFIRKCLTESKAGVITGDILFGISTTVASFFFMVHYNNGQVRLNLIVGQVASAMVLHIILGSRILKFMSKPAGIIRGIFSFLTIPFKTYLKLLPLGIEKIKKYKTHKKEQGRTKEIKKGKIFNFITKIYLKNKNKSV